MGSTGGSAGSEANDVDPRARQRLALALDLDDLNSAQSMARTLAPWFAVVKVGLELYSAAGPAAVSAMIDDGFEVFVDVKLHDIPTTVRRSASALGRIGATYVTVHLAGGASMVHAAVEGLAEGARSGGAPGILGVTVLTSDETADPGLIAARAELAAACGCRGVVCGGPDLPVVRRIAPYLLAVVPGIRLPGVSQDDQSRISTPGQALASGAGMLVVGRTVTAASDPVAAAAAVHRDLAVAMAAVAQPAARGGPSPTV